MLKLPFTHAFIERLLTQEKSLATAVKLLTEEQRAAVYAILLFDQKKPDHLNRLFGKCMSVVSQQSEQDTEDDLVGRLAAEMSSNIWGRIEPYMDCKPDDSLYLSLVRSEDRQPALEQYEHLTRYSGSAKQYTDEQARIFQTIQTQPDESIDIQGFGGTGKTHLIRELCHSLNQDALLVTAMSQAQLTALTSRIGNFNGKAQTFGSIANDALCANLLLRKRFNLSRTRGVWNVPSEKIARAFNIHDLGNFRASKVVDICRQMIYSFSYSTDSVIALKHLPKYSHQLLDADKNILVSVAQLLWEETVNPANSEIDMPQSEIHQIKYMALMRIPIPEQHRIVLCDEAHDIPPVVMQILDYSPQATLTFRDRYQAFNRNRVVKGRSSVIRSKSLASSVRSGVDAISLCNKALIHHPYCPEEMLQPTDRGQTKVLRCSKQGIPDETCAILAPNAWYVFCVAYDLWKAGSKFSLLTDSYGAVKRLISEAIELFNGTISLAFQKDLSNARSWEEFLNNSLDQVSHRVNEILESGFQAKHLEALYDSHQKLSDNDPARDVYIIGRFEDAKNREYDKVYYYSPLEFQRANNKAQLSYMINQTYTALTRAKYQLWIPGELDNWMDDTFKK